MQPVTDGVSRPREPVTGCYDWPANAFMPTFPEWWNWDLSFTSHTELRMEQPGVTEVDVRAMLEKTAGFEPNAVEGRFMIHVRHRQHPWIVIVEPDADAKLLVVVTVYEVSE